MEEKVTPHFSEVFKGPFTADEQCCYIWCNDGTQVCFDVMDERDAALGKRIADCLNDFEIFFNHAIQNINMI